MKNLEFPEILNSISYNVSDFEKKNNNGSEFGLRNYYCNKFWKHKDFLSVKISCKVFHKVPDLDWGLQNTPILE